MSPSARRPARKPPPHEFVLELLARLWPETQPMFGALAVYVGERIVMILRDTARSPADNGVWLVIDPESEISLRKEMPSLRGISLFADGGPRNWRMLPQDSDRFEEDALQACSLVLRADPRIGKVPESRKAKAVKSRKAKRPTKKKAASARRLDKS